MLDSESVSDDVEVNRRASSTEEFSSQEQPTTSSIASQLRQDHRVFVYKIYITSLLLAIGVAVQWFFITMIKLVQKFVTFYNYVLLAVIFIHYLMLTFMHYVLVYKNRKLKGVTVIYVFMLVEFGSIIITRPIVESNMSSLLYATLMTVIIYIISLFLASNIHMQRDRSQESLTMWSLMCFLSTAIWLIIALELSFAKLKMSIVVILIFFLTIFFFIWGRSISSVQFYRTEYRYLCYYLILHYFNIISLFANALVFFEKIRDIT